jgi:uncharacterized RDD family membrane protein YckC
MNDPQPVSESYGQSMLLPPYIHLILDDKDTGPLEPVEVFRLFDEGRVGPATPAWHPALDDWREIAHLPEIAWILAAPSEAAETPLAGPVLADFGPRFAAGAVDLSIWLVLVTLTGILLGIVMNRIQGVDGPVLGVRFNILAQIGALLYFVLPMSRIGGGATPGYFLFGLKLVDRDNLQAPGLIQTFVWYMTTYVRLIGCLTYFIDTQHRMFHNFVSRTLVIIDRPGKVQSP